MSSARSLRASTFAIDRTPRQRRVERWAKRLALAFIATGCGLLLLSVFLA